MEDEKSQLKVLADIVSGMGEDICVYTATNAKDAYSIAMNCRIDCFMADIVLDSNAPGDTSGMRFIENMRKVDGYYNTPVFFITSLEDPSNYAYINLHCIDYIEKPFDAKRIIGNLRKVLQIPIAENINKKILFRKDGILYPIKCKDIVYIESVKRQLMVCLCDGDIFWVPYRTCKDVMEEVGACELMQCNRGIIVNMDYVDSIDRTNNYITLKNNMAKLEIGITFRDKILGYYKK